MSHLQEFDEKYLPVLEDIERVVIGYYKQHSDLSDHDMDRIYEALNKVYKAEARKSAVPTVHLPDLDQPLYDLIKPICEWWLGRGSPSANQRESVSEPKTVEEMLIVLKRLIKSVAFWTKDSGRQGYLNYVSKFIK